MNNHTPQPANTSEELYITDKELDSVVADITNSVKLGYPGNASVLLRSFINRRDAKLYAALEAPENRLTWKHDDGTETEYVKLSAVRSVFNMKEEADGDSK